MPHAEDSEKALLCSMIKDPEVLSQCVDRPRELFYHTGNQEIYTALVQLHKAGKPVDWPIMVHQLETTNKLAEAGGKDALNAIWEFVPCADNWKFYMDILEDRFLRRKAILTSQAIATDAQDLSIDIKVTLERIQILMGSPAKELKVLKPFDPTRTRVLTSVKMSH